jgi:adenylate cyclase class 2
MLKSPRKHEIEIKLCVKDVSALRHRLKQLRARVVFPRTHESNTLYDTPKKDLTRRGQLIRIRIEQPSFDRNRKVRSRPTNAILTYKGPPQSARTAIDKSSGCGLHLEPARIQSGRYKIREEIEIAVSDGEQMRRILVALGLRPLFVYEKFRTTYVLPGVRGLKIELDETPIGTFLELEGAPPAIDRVAGRLGYTRADYVTQTYGALYIADCRRRGRKPANMLFLPKK